MKILFIAAHDAVNLSVENVVRELVRRGHYVDIYARATEHHHIRMFESIGKPILPVSQLTKEIAESYDCAFCPMDSVRSLIFYDIYIFTYNFIFNNCWTSPGGDFMFMQTENRPVVHWEECARMAVGTPKNDTPKVIRNSKKQILFIDTGHFPFGESGKHQLGETILSMCKHYPDYNFIIKPRWLPNDKSVSHSNSIHLYNVLQELCSGRLPDNLQLLYEHKDMQELIDESITVVTPASSAYLDAALRGKGVVILDGFDSEISYDLRIDTIWKQQLDDMRDSGCVINFRNICDYLPHGIQCSEKHLNRVLAYRGNVSEKIVEVMEYVVEYFISQDLFPAISSYDLKDYKAAIKPDRNLTYIELKQNRIKNSVMVLSRRMYWHVAKIDYSQWFSEIDSTYKNYPCTLEGLKQFESRMVDFMKLIWIENGDELSKNAVDQSIFIKALADMKQISKLMSIRPENILCKGAYHYHIGMAYRAQGDKTEALKCFVKYISDRNTRTFKMYPQDEVWAQKIAYNFIFEVYDKNNIDVLTFFELYTALYERNDPLIVSYRNRRRVHNLLPGIASQLYEFDCAQAYRCFRFYSKWEYHYNIRERDETIKTQKKYINEFHCSKSYRYTQKVKGVFKKVRGGVLCYKEHGFVYTFNHLLNKIKKRIDNSLKKTKNISFLKLKTLFDERVMKGFEQYVSFLNKYGDNAKLFLSAPGTGDTCIFGSFYDAYVREKGGYGANVYGVFGKGSKKIARGYDISDVEVYSMDEFRKYYNLLMFLCPGTLQIENMHYHIFYRHTAILSHIEGLHNFDFKSFAQAYLDIPDEEVIAPSYPPDVDYLTNYFLENCLLPDKTVLLTPYAKTFKQLPMRFWIKIALRLKNMGLCVCTNSVGNSEFPVPGTAAVCVPYDQVFPFVEMAGFIIGERNGVHDVISSAHCLKISLYPRDNYRRGKIYDINKAFNMNDMYHQPDQYDLIYYPEGEDELVEQIVDIVLEYQQRERKEAEYATTYN